MEPIKVEMTLTKETKGTRVYSCANPAGKPPAIRTLYVEKWALGENPPAKIVVKVE